MMAVMPPAASRVAPYRAAPSMAGHLLRHRAPRAPASAAPWRRLAAWRRRLAAVLLVLLASLVLLPAIEAFEPGDDRCCSRGVCCHHRAPSDSECLRGICPCSAHDAAPPSAPLRVDAVLPLVAVVPHALLARGLAPSQTTHAATWSTPPPDHPPRTARLP